jgi:hypothetical protein
MVREKGDVDPLLGQSFFKYFNVEFSPEAGRLSLKKLETSDADSKLVADADSIKSAPKAAKSRRPTRQPRTTAKSKRPARGRRQSAPGGDDQAPPDAGTSDPNRDGSCLGRREFSSSGKERIANPPLRSHDPLYSKPAV